MISAMEQAHNHLEHDHQIFDADDLPTYLDATFDPIEVVAMMRRLGDCSHELSAIYKEHNHQRIDGGLEVLGKDHDDFYPDCPFRLFVG